jgi:hypothetical protein
MPLQSLLLKFSQNSNSVVDIENQNTQKIDLFACILDIAQVIGRCILRSKLKYAPLLMLYTEVWSQNFFNSRDSLVFFQRCLYGGIFQKFFFFFFLQVQIKKSVRPTDPSRGGHDILGYGLNTGKVNKTLFTILGILVFKTQQNITFSCCIWSLK